MRINLRVACVFVSLSILAGCANMQTLDRKSRLPLDNKAGRAIHLDAQQRLIVFTGKRYCAEPSPDALAAYAAALGVGAGRLPGETIAGSAAFNGLAGSIGLRTQSITLMRDTLYRTCEMMLNDQLSRSQVAVFLARSQDLTAVIMAIESLTGAVAAAPITLAPGGSASSTAAILTNVESLAAARKKEEESKEAYEKAKQATKDAEKEHNEAKTALSNAEKAVLPDTPVGDPLRDTLKDALDDERDARMKKESAAKDEERAEEIYGYWKEAVAALEQMKDSAMAGSAATVNGTAYAGTTLYQPRLDEKTVTTISATVEKLVGQLLEKPYVMELCLAALTRKMESDPGAKIFAMDGQAQKPDPPVEEQSISNFCMQYFDNQAEWLRRRIDGQRYDPRGDGGTKDGQNKTPKPGANGTPATPAKPTPPATPPATPAAPAAPVEKPKGENVG